MSSGIQALYSESDLAIARTAMEYNISLLKMLSQQNPENREYHLYLSQALGFYSFAFVEDSSRERARALYRRGMIHALQSFKENQKPDLNLPLKDFKKAVSHLGRDAVPSLFWLCYNWGGYLQLSLDNPAEILNLTRLEELLLHLEKLNENYNFGGVHLLLGSFYSARPLIFGGNPRMALKHFRRCREIAGKEFLLIDFMKARYLAVQTRDLKLFQDSIQNVMEWNPENQSEYALFNAVAKAKAESLMKKQDSYFPE